MPGWKIMQSIQGRNIFILFLPEFSANMHAFFSFIYLVFNSLIGLETLFTQVIS